MQRQGEQVIYLYRHQYSGKSQVVPCRLSLMGPGDIDEATRLHYDATKGLGPDIFVPTEPDELERLLTDDGISIGVWHEDRLMCMRAVQLDTDWVNKTLVKMDMEPDESGRTAITDHCIVAKCFRGNNIQFLTHYAIENLLAQRCDTIITTVAPQNIFSLNNIFSCNFNVINLTNMYGGYLRYTLEKRFKDNIPIWTNWHHNVPIREIGFQQNLISKGCVGYKLLRTKPKGFSILYAPMSEEVPEFYVERKPAFSILRRTP